LHFIDTRLNFLKNQLANALVCGVNVSNSKDYAEMVAAAESAVSSVKDAELRRSAFQIVLEDLLAGGSGKLGLRGKREKRSEPPTEADSGRTKRKRGSSRSGTQSYVDELLSEGFFKKQKNISEVKAELENRGHHIPLTSLSGPLQRMCKERELRRQKITKAGSRPTYSYSNW
jgi:hypothetical protein